MSLPKTNFDTPKERFVQSKDRVEAHRFIISHAQFDNSIDTALLQYAHELSRGKPEQAGAHHFCMVGAQEFVRVLKTLSEVVAPARTVLTGQLNHQA